MLNIVGVDTILRNILKLGSLSNFYFLILLNEKQHSKVLHVTFKMSSRAFSQLQKIIGSRAFPELESNWQKIWRLVESRINTHK